MKYRFHLWRALGLRLGEVICERASAFVLRKALPAITHFGLWLDDTGYGLKVRGDEAVTQAHYANELSYAMRADLIDDVGDL